MEPINININVQLSDKTLEELNKIAAFIASAVICSANPAEVKNLADALKEDAPAAEAEPAKEEPAVEAPAQAEATVEEVSQEMLFEAVKSARQERGVKAATVKALFAKFNIANSGECPAERRAELYAEISKLSA